MKKRVVSLLMITLMVASCFALAACGGSDNPYVGKWKATKISAYGLEMTPEEADMQFEVEFKSDGSVSATTNGEDDGVAEWTETEDGVTITSNGEEMTAVLDDEGRLILTMHGVDITMEKQ